MAAWSFRTSYDAPPSLNLAPQIGSNIRCELPRVDYYIHQDRGIGTDDDLYNLANDGPIARCIVESENKVYIERNLYAHLTSAYKVKRDFYQDEDAELHTLANKPPTFIIFGKPGVGSSTLGKKMVEYLNCVYLSPESIIEYYRHHFIPEYILSGSVLLDQTEIPPDSLLLPLFQSRMMELDVLHKGYVLDGIPRFNEDSDMDFQYQLNLIMSFEPRPEYVILPYMQNVDLFKRRSEQKVDSETGEKYSRSQYTNKKTEAMDPYVDKMYFQRKKRKHSLDITTDAEYAGLTSMVYAQSRPDLRAIKEPDAEFMEEDLVKIRAIPSEVMLRLITSEDDSPYNIERSLQRFRLWLPYLQAYVDTCDIRKVLELNAYWAPPIIFKMVLEFIDNFGLTPAPLVVKLINEVSGPKMLHSLKSDETIGEEEDEGPFPCEPPLDKNQPIDWPAVLRACTVRSRVDPRFRWRLSRWKNLCPVALKNGRSLFGKPEFAVGFLDKIYFLSSKAALKVFEFNPRPYLLPTMPRSPVKFFIFGHPLTGKSLFCKRLAEHCGGSVIDMKHEFRKRFHQVKFDYLFKVKMQTTIQAMLNIDHENYEVWKRHERKRRTAIMEWIERFLRRKADNEVNSLLKMAKEERDSKRVEMYLSGFDHKIGDVLTGACTTDRGGLDFSWKQFVADLKAQKYNFTLQQRLELAWSLFRQGRLYYKGRQLKKKKLRELIGEFGGEGSSDFGSGRGDAGSESEFEDEEEYGEGSEEEEEAGGSSKETKKKKHRHRKPCIPVEVKKTEEDEGEEKLEVAPFLEILEPKESTLFELEEETDESLKIQFPELPAELIDGPPRPANVLDSDEQVIEYVNQKLAEAEIWADSMPPLLYVEVLRRAIKDTESKYLERHATGPMSGGWIVDNMELRPDVFRATLLTPDTCPDKVITLLDYTANYAVILNRLKVRYLKSEAKKAAEIEAALFSAAETSGEDDDFPLAKLQQEKNMSSTELLISMLPVDDLTRKFSYEFTQSQLSQLKRDLDRQVSLVDSDVDISADYRKLLEAWFKSFDNTNRMVSGGGSSGRAEERSRSSHSSQGTREVKILAHDGRPSTGRSRAFTPYDNFHQTSQEKVQWNGRLINYEMLTHLDPRPETEGGFNSMISDDDSLYNRTIISDGIQSNHDPEDKRKRLKTLNLNEYLGEDIDIDKVPLSVLEQVGEDGNVPSLRVQLSPDEYWTTGPDARTPQGILSRPDIVCDLPPEGAKFSHEILGEDGEFHFRYGNSSREYFGEADIGDGGVEYFGEDGLARLAARVAKTVTPPSSPCVPKIHSPSIRRKFLESVNLFNDFWTKAVPLMNHQQVQFFELSAVNEDSVIDQINRIWDDLESRFVHSPSTITEGDLFDEDVAWKTAVAKWTKEEELERKRLEERMTPKYDEYTGEDDENSQGIGQLPDASDYSEDLENESEESLAYDDASEADSDLVTEKVRHKEAELAKNPENYLEWLTKQRNMRLFGDTKDYCPVTLHDHALLRKGSPKHALKFRDRVHYFVNQLSSERFNENPLKFLPKASPPNVPPPRICITGSPGCGQEEVGLEAAREYGIYYFNFRQRLHEIIRVKLGKNVGPPQNIAEALNGTGSGSLLGLKTSNSDFEIPSTVLFGLPKISKPEIEEFEGEGSDYLRNSMQDRGYSIGIEKSAQIFECPISSIERTEVIAERNWARDPNFIEVAIKDFLENGDQLPDNVLSEFIAPFWHDEPFKSNGFVMIGFPNTDQDVEFLARHDLFPEFVYIMDCKPKTMRNRLITKTVDEWHDKHPTSTKSLKSKSIASAKFDKSSNKKKREFSRMKALFGSTTVQRNISETSQDNSDELLSKRTWGYKDSISSDISTSLHEYHELYSKGLGELKKSLNESRISWKLFHTDFSLQMSKTESKKCLTSTLKYRNSLFESTYPLFQHEALALLERGFFQLSKFGRWCPVQLSKGNTAVNLWNGPGIKKIPVLHRHYIYYIAGEENVEHFRENVWNLISQEIPSANMPLYIVVTGVPKSGKSILAQKLAYKLGLVYISEESMMDEIVKHSFLNKISEDFDMSSAKLSSGPQSMLTADEILAYLRDGYTVPPYMVCRVLDLALMAPRAQFHGVVFDNYPLEESQLQELLERGVVPSLVINLKMELPEMVARCERHLFDPTYNYESLLEESPGLADQLYNDHKLMAAPILQWFQNETQCLLNVNATEHPTAIFEKVVEHAFAAMEKLQRYINNHQNGKPSILDGTTPLTSMLHTKFSREFGYYDPVALNEHNELVQVTNYTDLTKVVEYQDQIYIFSNHKHVDMFIKNPEKYTFPTCQNTPPKILPSPCVLTPDEMLSLEPHWGFQDFDPVFYFEGNFQFKWLKRGESKYCAEYNGKLYFFVSHENLVKFLKRPWKYCNVPIPTKFPSRLENPLDTVSPPGYIIATGLSQELCRMISLVASKRPRFPFMSTTRSGLLYLGYYLKTLNMKAPCELRTHYRKAMAHMTNTQSAVEKLCLELNELHGKRSISADTKRRLKLLIELAEKADDEKVVDPYIHGEPFSYDSATVPQKSSSNLDLLRDILIGDNEPQQLNLLPNDKAGTLEEIVERMTPGPSGPASITSLVEDYVPPPYLATDKLY